MKLKISLFAFVGMLGLANLGWSDTGVGNGEQCDWAKWNVVDKQCFLNYCDENVENCTVVEVNVDSECACFQECSLGNQC